MAQLEMPVVKHWRFAIDIEGIGWLTLERADGSVNTLGREVLAELELLVERIEDLVSGGELIGLVLVSGKPGGFIAGADISEFDAMADFSILPEALRRTHTLFTRIENLRVPVVAGIHGYCLGGGLELALACHYRIAVEDEATKIGFPEVRLGIFPGFGGTGRSIRQAGPADAMGLMLSGRNLSARQAKRMNLVDRLVRHKDMLRWAARKAVLGRLRSRRAGFFQRIMGKGPLRDVLAARMRDEVKKKAPRAHYPAPYALIELFERHGGNPAAMSAGEIEAFVPLMGSPTARNLRRVFFLSEGLKRQAQKGAPFRRVHVIGAGVMGGDIAAWCALRGLSVTLEDVDMGRIGPALERARALFKKKLRAPGAAETAMTRLEADPEGKGVARADVVIEAVVENLEVKRALMRRVEPRLKPGAVLATNTSSIEIERIAEALAAPERLMGLHFFNPVAQLPLVEVIRSRLNDEALVGRGVAFALAIGKSPVVVRSKPGFLVNRVLMPYMVGAVERLERGESKELLDAAAVAFGMPMGPIELLDMVGLDVGLSVARELGHKVPEGSRFTRLVADGRLGRKTGEGFYRWEKGKARKGETPAHEDLAGLGRELVGPLVEESARAVADGVVASAELADIGVILGTGFPPFLGGPLKARADGRA